MGGPVGKDAYRNLHDYYAINDGKMQARYLRCKNITISADPNADDSSLYRLHDQIIDGILRFDAVPKNKVVSLLELKIELASRIHKSCKFCERRCGVNRGAGKKGVCGVLGPKIACEFIHWGEEPELVPSHTIFFSGCTFKCVFCQNWDISQFPDAGNEVSARSVAEWIERRSARNVNWVGGEPTPNIAFILRILSMITKNTPQVWNSNMYMSNETMRLLDGVVDLYLTDFKYGNDSCAQRLSGVENYWKVATRNHTLANRQCEMIIRHLVMPNHVECCSIPIMKWISSNLDTGRIRVNIMDQYRPEYNAYRHPEIDRRLKIGEYRSVVKYAEKLGLDLTD